MNTDQATANDPSVQASLTVATAIAEQARFAIESEGDSALDEPSAGHALLAAHYAQVALNRGVEWRAVYAAFEALYPRGAVEDSTVDISVVLAIHQMETILHFVKSSRFADFEIGDREEAVKRLGEVSAISAESEHDGDARLALEIVHTAYHLHTLALQGDASALNRCVVDSARWITAAAARLIPELAEELIKSLRDLSESGVDHAA